MVDSYGSGRLLNPGGGACPVGTIGLAGVIRDGAGLTRFRDDLDTFALVLPFGEEGSYEDASGERRRIGSGDGFILSPNGPAHRYGPLPGRRWDEVYACFAGPLFELWRERSLIRSPVHFLRMSPPEYWFRRVVDAVDPGLTALEQLTRLQAVLGAVLGHQDGDGVDRDRWIKRAVKAVIDMDGETDYRTVARRLGVSYETFRKRFAEGTGRPPHRFRLDHLIERACDRMHRESLTNAQLADRLGICNEYHFAKLFKDRMGVSPGEFRSRMRLKR